MFFINFKCQNQTSNIIHHTSDIRQTHCLFPVLLLTFCTSSASTESTLLLKRFLIYVKTCAISSSLKKLCCGIRLLYGLPFTVIGSFKPFNTTSINFFLSPFTHSGLSKGGNRFPSPFPSYWWQDTQ